MSASDVSAPRPQSDFLPTEVFPLLADPDNYVACRWDLSQDHHHRDYWLPLFRRHFPSMLEEAVVEAVDRGVAEAQIRKLTDASHRQMNEILDQYAARPGEHGRWNIMTLCLIREEMLRAQGIVDPYRLIKQRENASAMRFLPALLEELDRVDEQQLPTLLAQGMFAGNIFDLGATSTLAMFQGGKSVDFRAVREKLKPRPWLVDGLDAWLARLAQDDAHKSAVLFVDNAGCDIVLGMIPFARYLLSRGTNVLLTANETPSLNDVTIDELRVLVDEIATWDSPIREALADGRLELVSSGNGAPLIDLAKVSPALVEAVTRREVDLVVLEGMGRGVESNFDASLRCETIKVAMIKDKGVADAMKGELYDLVFRYDAVGTV